MSNQSIADVELDLKEETPEFEVEGESSTPKQEIVVETEVETPEAEVNSDAEAVETEVEDDASPVEDSRKKPGDMIPRTRLNEEILKKKKNAEELQREREGNETLRRELDELRNSTPKAPNAKPYPSLFEDGIDDEEQLRVAQSKWQSDEVARQIALSENKRNIADQKQKSQDTSDTFNQKLKAYANKHPEYADDYKEAGDPAWPELVNNAVQESDVGPALDHYLLKNPEERNRILAMNPRRALMALGVIENSIANPQPKKKAKPRLTTAPDPIERSEGGVTGKPEDPLKGWIIE